MCSSFFAAYSQFALEAVGKMCSADEFQRARNAAGARNVSQVRNVIARSFDESGNFVEKSLDRDMQRWARALRVTFCKLEALVENSTWQPPPVDPKIRWVDLQSQATFLPVAASYAHMMNDRLGVTISAEAIIASLLAEVTTDKSAGGA
jgi:hypothetical protein